MRWLFFAVFLLNIVYIAWGLSRSPAEPYADVPPLKNVQPIVLLSELKQEKEAGANVGEKLAVVQKTLPQENSFESTSSEQNQPVEDQVALDVVKPAPATGKVAGETVAADNKLVDDVEVPQAEPIQVANCYTLGPFRDMDKLRGLRREIKPFVDSTEFRGREEKKRPLYWVYIKPEKNRSKAFATAKRLQAKKIKDFYVLREGEKVNGISLGYFRSKRRANNLLKKVKKLGFDVELEPIIKTHTVYWLDYQVSSGKSIPQITLDKYLKSTKKDKISRLSRDCDVGS